MALARRAGPLSFDERRQKGDAIVMPTILGGFVVATSLITLGGPIHSETKGEPGLKELAERRVEIASRAFKVAEQMVFDPPRAGAPYPRPGVIERTVDWSSRWMAAQLDLADGRESRSAAIRSHVERLEALLPIVSQNFAEAEDLGVRLEVDLMEYRLLEAKAALLKAQGG